MKRGSCSVSLGLDDERFVRIMQNGRTDTNGGRQGPWTEFNIEAGDGGLLFLFGAKSERWLTVVDGEFQSSDVPEPLTLEMSRRANHVASLASVVHLRMVDNGYGGTLPWMVQVVPTKRGQVVLLKTSDGNVACGQNGNGKVHNGGQEGQWAQWEMTQGDAGASFKNVGHGKYLWIGSDGAPQLHDDPAFFISEIAAIGEISAPSAPVTSIDESVLSKEALDQFKQHGYIVLKGAVLPELVRDALRSINHLLGTPGCWEADSNPLNAAQLVLKLPPRTVGVCQDIMNKSPRFWSAVNVLLGSGNVSPWKGGTQVALRFPQAPQQGFDVPDTKPGTQYHIDGMGQNKLCPFSLLCGVALSEQAHESMGNLHVFPGSHLNQDLHRYYREKISDDDQNETDENKPNLGASVQVLLEPGDIVIAHQLLAHRVGVNTSEHIRYQLYYRVKHKDHNELKGQILDDPWAEFAI